MIVSQYFKLVEQSYNSILRLNLFIRNCVSFSLKKNCVFLSSEGKHFLSVVVKRQYVILLSHRYSPEHDLVILSLPKRPITCL